VGIGIKRTHAYRSKLPLEEVKLKRVEFWGKYFLLQIFLSSQETRVEGERYVWKALWAASEANESKASFI